MVNWPLFVKDRDGWMFLLRSDSDVQNEIEPIDIEDKEYTVWDSRGQSVRFQLCQNRIEVIVVSPESHLEELKNAILNYAMVARPQETFLYGKEKEKDITNLFMAVEDYIESGRLYRKFIKKIKEIIKR